MSLRMSPRLCITQQSRDSVPCWMSNRAASVWVTVWVGVTTQHCPTPHRHSQEEQWKNTFQTLKQLATILRAGMGGAVWTCVKTSGRLTHLHAFIHQRSHSPQRHNPQPHHRGIIYTDPYCDTSAIVSHETATNTAPISS